jgi:hypothetical protein
MTSDNPVTARLIRGIDQGRMRSLKRASLATGIVINLISLTGMIVFFGTSNPAVPWLNFLMVFPLTLVGVFALSLLVAGLASEITHREIAGEGGDILWITPLEDAAIAEGFIKGVTRCLVWAQWFVTGFIITAGLAGGFIGIVVLLTLPAPFPTANAPPTPPLPLLPPLAIIVALLVGGIPAAAIADGIIRGLIRLGNRAGIATAFWQRDRDAASVRGIAGALMLGILLLMLLGCSVLPWLPLGIMFFARYPTSGFGTVAAVIFGLILSLALPGEVNTRLQRLLLRSIERARSRR